MFGFACVDPLNCFQFCELKVYESNIRWPSTEAQNSSVPNLSLVFPHKVTNDHLISFSLLGSV